MKYLAFSLLFVSLIIGMGYYIFSSVPSDSWKIDTTLLSPNNQVKAIVRCNKDGGTTVGFYCKLFLEMNKKEYQVLMARTDKINIEWITSNILTAKVIGSKKIYDFTSVYWDVKTKNEYFVKLEY